jgi:hypothetical protein
MTATTEASETLRTAREQSGRLAHHIDELANVIRELEQIAPLNQDGAPSFVGESEKLRQRAQQVREGRFQVLVMGEFKNGKSTLLNAMLNSPILPQKAMEATAVITRIRYGDAARVEVFFADDRPSEVLSLEEFKREYELKVQDVVPDGDEQVFMDDGRPVGEPISNSEQKQKALDRFSHVRFAVVYAPLELCRYGVELVDSPGLGAGETRRERTERYLDSADAIVLVLNAQKFATDDEKHVIENILWARGLRNIFFVVNRWNQVGDHSLDPEVDRSEMEEVIYRYLKPFCRADGLDRSADRIFLVNAFGALAARMGKASPETLEESQVPDFEQALARFLAGDRVAIEHANAALSARISADAARRHVRWQLANAHKPLVQLEQDRQRLEPKLAQLRKIRNYISTYLEDQSRNLQEQLVASLTMHLTQLRDPERLRDEVDRFDLQPIMSGLVYWKQLTDRLKRNPDAKFANKIERIVKPQVQQLLERKLAGWQRGVIENRLPTITRQIQTYLEERAAEYQDIVQEIEGQMGAHGDPIDINEQVSRWIGSAWDRRIGSTRFDISAGAAAGDFTPVMVGIAGDIVADIVLHTTFHALPVIGTAMSAALIFIREKGAREKIKLEIVKALDEGLRKATENEAAAIRREVGESFRKLNRAVTESIGRDVEQLQMQLDALIEMRRHHEAMAQEQSDHLRAWDASIGQIMARIEAEAGRVAA